MNSLEFHLAAGEAIAVWGQTHREGCLLSLVGETVLCSKLVLSIRLHNNPLQISTYEVSHGMKICRWNDIGTELYNLYSEELACQTHQKH